MAFSSAERGKIRWYLGQAARFYQIDSALEQAMTAVDADAEALIRTQLGKLDTIVTDLDGAKGRLKAAEVGSIVLPGGVEIGVLRSEGRRMVGQIASALGVAVEHDVFSAGAPPNRRVPW